MHSEDIFCKQCARCEEIMPITETVCYCSGPVKIVNAGKDKKHLIDTFWWRKTLWRLKKS